MTRPAGILRLFAIAVGVSIVLPTSAQAQCRAGFDLVDEDDDYYYCEARVTDSDFARVINALAVASPDPAMLGEQWRYRKAIIDLMGCLVRNRRALYEWGSKVPLPIDCRNVTSVDCSGASAYGTLNACFVLDVQAAVLGSLSGLQTNARGQAAFFKQQGAWVVSDATPHPGDLVFFKTKCLCTQNGDISHVGVYLGTASDGYKLMMHAEQRAGRVTFTRMKPGGYYDERIVGYGDTSLLYLKARSQ